MLSKEPGPSCHMSSPLGPASPGNNLRPQTLVEMPFRTGPGLQPQLGPERLCIDLNISRENNRCPKGQLHLSCRTKATPQKVVPLRMQRLMNAHALVAQDEFDYLERSHWEDTGHQITTNELSTCAHEHTPPPSRLCTCCSLSLDHPSVFFTRLNPFLSLETHNSSVFSSVAQGK